MSLRNDSQTDSTQKRDLLSALTNQYCRFVPRYFRSASEKTATVEELSAAFASEYDEDENQATLRLHHTALPRLSDVGVVDYNTQRKTVQYHGHPEFKTLLGTTDSDSKQAVKAE